MALFSCIISNISSSTTSPLSPTVPCLSAAVALSLLFIAFSFVLVAITYLLGQVLQIQALKNWYLSEFWETIKTCLIVASIFFVLVILSAIAATYAAPPSIGFSPSYPSSPLSLSTVTSDLNNNLGYLYTSDQTFLDTQIDVTNNAFYSMLGLSEGLGVLKSINVSLWTPTLVFTNNLQSGFVGASIYTSDYFISSTASTGAGIGSGMITNIESYAIIPTLFMLYIETYLFYSIIAIALLVFLPLGIVFRSIPLFRNVGALMIAISIGIAIIFPTLMLALNEPVIDFVANTFGISLFSPSVYAAPPLSGGINLCGNLDTSAPAAYNLLKGFCNDLGSIVTSITSWFSKLNPAIPGSYINSIKYGIATAYDSIYSAYPAVNYTLEYGIIPIVELILFTLDLMITIISVNAISALLGGKALQTSFGKRIRLV